MKILLRLYGLGWGYPEQRRRIELVTAGRFQVERADVESGLEGEAFLWPTCRMVGSAKMRVIDPGLMDDWLTERESAGFRSHLSASQTALTLAALLNLADFVHDLRDRALRLCDRLLRQLAEHTCEGVVSGPQAVADRYILYPHSAWTQGLLSFAAGSNVVESFSPWAVFLASSAYRSPSDLNALIQRATSRTYHEAGWPLSPHKTDYGMLSSVAIDITRSVDAKSRHLWHATLGRGCHVFVNHPSSPSDDSEPFWHGNGVTPRIAQEGNTLFTTYDIPENHPIGFTHAHWPIDAFEGTLNRDGWHIGRSHKGAAIGLWWNLPTQLTSDVLQGRELRAWGQRAAWICVCGAPDNGSIEIFLESCLSSRPELRESGQLVWEGQIVL